MVGGPLLRIVTRRAGLALPVVGARILAMGAIAAAPTIAQPLRLPASRPV